MRDNPSHDRGAWIEAFDRCCDGIKDVTVNRNRGENNTLRPFYERASELWLLLDRAPEDLDLECRTVANLLVGDYLRDHHT